MFHAWSVLEKQTTTATTTTNSYVEHANLSNVIMFTSFCLNNNKKNLFCFKRPQLSLIRGILEIARQDNLAFLNDMAITIFKDGSQMTQNGLTLCATSGAPSLRGWNASLTT